MAMSETDNFKTFIHMASKMYEDHRQFSLKSLLFELNELNDKYSIIEYKRLEEKRQFNIIRVFGIERMEPCHSNFIAWLLDPLGSHGIKNAFLNGILSHFNLERISNGTYIVTREAHSPHGYVDIHIEGSEYLIIIENKLFSQEGIRQTHRYYDDYESKAGPRRFVPIFLTPPGKIGPAHAGYRHLTYRDILHILTNIEFENNEIRIIIEHYKKYIKEYLKGGFVMNKFEGFSDVTIMYMEHVDMVDKLHHEAKEEFKAFYEELSNRLKGREWWNDDLVIRIVPTELLIYKKQWIIEKKDSYHFLSLYLSDKSLRDGYFVMRTYSHSSIERKIFFDLLDNDLGNLKDDYISNGYQLRFGDASYLQKRWPCTKDILRSKDFLETIVKEFDRLTKLLNPIDRAWILYQKKKSP